MAQLVGMKFVSYSQKERGLRPFTLKEGVSISKFMGYSLEEANHKVFGNMLDFFVPELPSGN